MKKLLLAVIACFSFLSLAYAQATETTAIQPIRVAASYFDPPFVIKGGHNQFYGFDISMMMNLCKQMNRVCVFESVKFSDLISAVLSNKADVAIGSIAITPERSKKITFSIPYLPTKCQLVSRIDEFNQPFNQELLIGKSIGVLRGSAFVNFIQFFQIKNLKIVPYDFEPDILDDLAKKRIDLAIFDAPTSRYWVMHSSGQFKTIGPEVAYGFGAGIAVDPTNQDLLQEINKALQVYLNSNSFKVNYNMYLYQPNFSK